MATIPGRPNLAAPASSALLWVADTAETPQDRNHSMAQLAKNIKKFNQEFVIDSSGGAIGLSAWQTANLILTYNGASTVTLPEASTCIGYRVRILAGYAGAALVTITPHTDDHIDLLAANTSIFLNNSDGGANVQKFRHVELMAIASGYWAVISGDFCPDQAVDTDGSQLCLGRLHRFPLGNTTNRQISLSYEAGWSSAQQISGLYGVPSKAKAVRVRVNLYFTANAAGIVFFDIGLSDNTSNEPSLNTAHPYIHRQFTATAADEADVLSTEMDVPLDTDGQLYVQMIRSNAKHPTGIDLTMLGYYMGD